MEITWYGTAAIILREGDRAIAFDPFFGLPTGRLKDQTLAETPKDGFLGVTDVFVTHGHFDHIYHLPALCSEADFQIHCTPTPRKTLMRRGVSPDRIKPMTAGMTDSVGPFTVTAYQSRHCRFDLGIIGKTIFRKRFFKHPIQIVRIARENLRFPENGEIVLYEVACGEKRIQVLGSLALDAGTEYPTGADVLILPFQGRSDLGKQGLDIVRRLTPRAVLLDHYDDTFPPISGDIETKDFIKKLREQEHIPCRAMEKGKEIYVKTETTLG